MILVNLSYREKNIINVLHKTSAYSFDEVHMLWHYLGSWDDVIRIMDLATEQGVSLHYLLSQVGIQNTGD